MLASHLHMPVEEMLERMSSRELSEWLAYYSLEPFGEFREDWRTALVATVIANTHRSKKTRPYKIKDFMFSNKRRPRAQTPDEQLQIVKEITIMYKELFDTQK